MRRFPVLVTIVFLVAACSADPEIVATQAATPADEVPAETPTPVPGTAPETPTPAAEQASAPLAPNSPADYLLTEKDLPGWQYNGPMEFGAEPTFESPDCDLMNQAWNAHAQPGTRIRATVDGFRLRQTVVQMPDAASAEAVLDAADRVWQECVQFEVGGGLQWVEPVQVPDAGPWRSAAIALGGEQQSISIIGYWQMDDRIVFVDLDGDRPWNIAELVFGAVVGRLTGAPSPAPAPTPEVPQLVQPSPTPEPLPTATTGPTPTPRPDWRESDLASLIPDGSEIGPGWELEDGDIVRPQPAGAEEIEGCDVPSPAIPPGIEVSYVRLETFDSIEIQVMQGTVEDAAGWPLAFRALIDCDVSADELVELAVLPVTVPEADDAVLLEATFENDERFGFGAEQLPERAHFGVATFDGLVVGVLWVGDEGPDAVVDLIQLVASKR